MTIAGPDTDTDRRSADWDLGAGASNYGALLFAQAGSALLSLLAVWLATDALGARGYGGVAALIAASQLAGSIAIQWTAASVFRHGCEEFVATGRIAETFWTRLTVLALNLALVVVLSPWWLPPVASWLEIGRDARSLVLLHLVTTSLSIHVQQSLYAAKLPRLQGLLQISERASLVAALAALVFSSRASFPSVALVVALVPLVPCLAGLWRLRGLIVPPVAPRRARLGRLLGFSYPLAFQLMVGFFTTNYLDAFFILKFLTASHLGVYTLSYNLAGQFMQLPSLAGSLLLAFLITSDTRGESDRQKRFFADVLPSAALSWSALAAIAAAAGSVLIGLFFDASFQPARKLLWPLMAAAAFAAPVIVGLGPAATARSRTVIPAVAAGVAATVNVTLNFMLIPSFGLVGCAWATTASFGAALLTWSYLVTRLLSVSSSWTIPATLPALVGAILAARGAGDGPALAASLACASLLLVAERRSVALALRAVSALPAVGALSLRLKRSFAGRWSDAG
jgi:O-antigen/teichoic acid export membrane protein